MRHGAPAYRLPCHAHRLLWLLLCMAACDAPRQPGSRALQDKLTPGNPLTRYSIGGRVNNSVASSWVKLASGDDLVEVKGSNNFTFPSQVYTGTNFAVTLDSAAAGTGCKIDNGIATMSTAPVSNVVVTCGPQTTATSLSSTSTAATVSAGQNSNVTITALVGGTVSYDYTGYVKFTSTDPNAILPPPYQYTANDGGVHAFPVVFNTAGTQSVTITGGSLSTSVSGVQVNALGIYYLQVKNFASPVTAGQQGNVTVTALDKYGNVAVSYVGRVQLGSSDPNAVLPAAHTFTVGQAGVATLPVTLDTAGTQSISAEDLTNAALPGSQNDIIVNPSVPAIVLVTEFPSPVIAGEHGPVLVTLEDAFGNLATNTNDVVTFISNDANAILSAPYRFTTSDGGSHVFDAALSTAGIRYIRVVDANRSGVYGVEPNILVNPNVGVRLAVHGYPVSMTAGQNANVWLTVYDAYGNVATSFAGTVVLSATCPNTTLGANPIAFTPTMAGNVAVPVTFTKAGTCALNANSSSPVMSAMEGNIVVSPNVAVAFSVTNFLSPVAAGLAENVTLTAHDAYGNVATGYTGTAALHSSDANAVLPGLLPFTPGNAGVLGASVTLETAGVQSISANDTTTSSIAGMEPNILVQPGNAKHFWVRNYPDPAVAGTQAAVTITAMDNFNNVATGYTGTIEFVTSDPNGVLPGSIVVGNANQGSVTVQVTLKTAGTQALQANDYAQPSIAGQEGNILVSPNAVVSFNLSNFPNPATSGVQGNVVVTAYDAYGNVGTNYTGRIYMGTNATTATLPPNRTFGPTDAGTVTLPVTIVTAGTWTLNANDNGTPGIAGAQTGIVVDAGNANHFGVVGFSSPIMAGTPNTFIVTAYDMYNNIVLGYVGQVALTSSDPLASLPGAYSFTGLGPGLDNGVHDFNATLVTAGMQNIIVTDTMFAAVTGNQNGIVVQPGNANRLAVTAFPNPTTAGQAHAVHITAYDAYGNIATGYTGIVGIGSTDPNFTPPATTQFLSAWAGAANITVTLVTQGLQNINANDTTTLTIAGRQLSILVNPGNANSLVAKNYPSTVVAGQPNTITVIAYDAYGNVATGFNDTVVLASADPNASLPASYTFTSTDAGIKTFNATLLTVGNQNLVVRDIGAAAFSASEPNIVVISASAVRLKVTGFPAAVTAGQQANMTITAYDAYGNIATGYTGQVAYGSSDPNAILPGATTFTALNAGVLQEPVTLTTVGTRWIQAGDTNIVSINGNQTGIVVSPNVAVRLALTSFPSPVSAGTQGNITITALDAYGNVATGYAGSVQLSSSDYNATLPGPISFAGKAGMVTVSATLQTAGDQTLTGNDTVTPSIAGIQATVVVGAGAAVRLKVANFPSPVTAGQQGNVTVTAYDNYNNIVTSYTGTVQLSSTDLNAILPSPHVFTSTDAGSANFTVTLSTSGNQSIHANDQATPGLSGNQNNIIVNPNVAAHLRAQGFPSPTNAGVQGNITITAYDAYGNPATSYTGIVQIRSTDLNAVLPSNYTFPGGVANANIPVTLKTAGIWAITGNDTVNTALHSIQRNIVVNPNSAARLTLTGFPASSLAGSTNYATVTAYDNSNNIATGYTGTVHFTSLDLNAVMPPDHLFSSSDAGTANLPVTFKTAGNWTLQANDTVNTGLWATETNRVIIPNVAVSLRVSNFPPTVTAGQPNTVLVTAYDAYGNVATGCTDKVQLSSTDPNAVLPYATAFSGSGNLLLAVTLIKVGTRAIDANDTSNPSVSGAQTGIIVNPNGADHFVVTGYPATVTAGQQANVNVAVYDIYNNLDTPYTGTVALSSTDPNAVLQGNYTYLAANNGDANLSLTFYTAGLQNVTVTDTTHPSVNGNQAGILVNPNIAAAHLYFATSPANANVCSGGQSAVVQVRDIYNNIVTNSNASITLAWNRNPNSAWLQGTLNANAVNGVATFSGLGVNRAGTNLSLSATSTGMIGAVSQNFTVTNVLPSITSISIPTNSNTVSTIGYYLRDVCVDNANVKAEVWTTAANAYQTATPAAGAPYGNIETPTAATQAGKSVSFSWDNSNAVKSVKDANVWVRLTPTTRNATGPATVYGPFSVDNRINFALSLANSSGTTMAAAKLSFLNHDAYIDVVDAYATGSTKTGMYNGSSFDPATATITTGTTARDVAVADFDRNGYNDIVTVFGTNSAQINWLSAGASVASLTLATGTTPLAVVTGDFNLDGNTDIAVANSSDHNLTLYRGAGPANNANAFATATTKVLPAAPTAMVASDVDRDGKLDLVMISSAAQAFYALINDGSGYFATHTVSTYAAPTAVQVLDADRNGTRDILVLTASNNTFSIYSNDGNGVFSSPYGFYTIGSAVDLKTGDFDSDGYQDVAVVASSGTLAVHRGLPAGNFAPYQSYTLSGTYGGVTPGTMRQLQVADINLDGKQDLLIAADTGSILALNSSNKRTNIYWKGQPVWFTGGQSASSAVVADVNSDGTQDVVVADPNASKLYMLRGDGSGALTTGVGVTFGTSPNLVIKADLNHDHIWDFVAANNTGNTVAVALGTGATGLTVQTSLSCGGTPSWVAAGDLDRDGNVDIVASVMNTNSLLRWLGHGDGTFGTSTSYATGNGPTGVALADLNSDGILDVAVTNAGDSNIATMFGTGTGAFQSLASFATDASPFSVTFGDMNGDGVPDAVLPTASGMDIMYTTAGTGALGAKTLLTYTGFGRNMALGDWDNNGTTDTAGLIYLGSPEGLNIVYYNNTITFTGYERRATNALALSNVEAYIAQGDLNGDGWIDIVTADGPEYGLGNVFNATITVALNNASGSNVYPTGSFNAGWPANVDNRYPFNESLTFYQHRDLAVGDINGDGVLDIINAQPQSVAGVNVFLGSGTGAFSTYTSTKTPQNTSSSMGLAALIYDLNQDSWLDMIVTDEAYYVDYAVSNHGQNWNSFVGWESQYTSTTAFSGDIAVTDFDRNGTQDIFLQEADVGLVYMSNDGNADLTNVSTTTGCNVAGHYFGSMCIGDVDNNATSDVVTANSNTLCIQLGNGSGTFSSGPTNITSQAGASRPVTCWLRDMNRDGKPDLVAGNSRGAPLYMSGNGDGTFNTATSVAANANSLSTVVDDLNGDGILDVAYELWLNYAIAIAYGNGDGTFRAPIQLYGGTRNSSNDEYFQSSLVTGDFDRDGRVDLAVLAEESVIYIFYAK